MPPDAIGPGFLPRKLLEVVGLVSRTDGCLVQVHHLERTLRVGCRVSRSLGQQRGFYGVQKLGHGASLPHKLVQPLGFETLLALGVHRHAVGRAIGLRARGRQGFDGFPQQGNLVLLARG